MAEDEMEAPRSLIMAPRSVSQVQDTMSVGPSDASTRFISMVTYFGRRRCISCQRFHARARPPAHAPTFQCNAANGTQQ